MGKAGGRRRSPQGQSAAPERGGKKPCPGLCGHTVCLVCSLVKRKVHLPGEALSLRSRAGGTWRDSGLVLQPTPRSVVSETGPALGMPTVSGRYSINVSCLPKGRLLNAETVCIHGAHGTRVKSPCGLFEVSLCFVLAEPRGAGSPRGQAWAAPSTDGPPRLRAHRFPLCTAHLSTATSVHSD